jgi:hypothetical protein
MMAKKSLRVTRRPLFFDEDIDNTIIVSPLKEPDFEYPTPPTPPTPPPLSPGPDPFIPTEDLLPLLLPTPLVLKQASKQLKSQIERIFWTFEMEAALFETLVGQCRLGLRADSGYKAGAWNKALEVVQCTYHGIRELLTVDKLKSKLSNYQQLYKDWKWLLGQSGFGIHPETRVVTAASEAWEEVIRVCVSTSIQLFLLTSFTSIAKSVNGTDIMPLNIPIS